MKQVYTLELPLMTDIRTEHILDKRLALCRRLYNQVVDRVNRMNSELRETSEFDEVWVELIAEKKYKQQNEIEGVTLKEKELYDKIGEMEHKKGLNKFGIRAVAIEQWKKMSANSQKNLLYYNTVEAIGEAVANAWDKSGRYNRKLRYKKYGEYNVIPGKSNIRGIRFAMDVKSNAWTGRRPAVKWYDLKILVKVDQTDEYVITSLAGNIKTTSIIRKRIHGKNRFFVKLVIEGPPPVKIERSGVIKYSVGNGRCVVYVGTEYVVAYNGRDKRVYRLGADADKLWTSIADVSRRMEASRRATNPQNYNNNGVPKRKKYLKWKYSNRYLKLRGEYQELHRRIVRKKKLEYEKIANEIIGMGDEFVIVKEPYLEMSKRLTNATVEINLTEMEKVSGEYTASENAVITNLDAGDVKANRIRLFTDRLYRLYRDNVGELVINIDGDCFVLSEEEARDIREAYAGNRFGNVITRNAPYHLVEILSNKLDYQGICKEIIINKEVLDLNVEILNEEDIINQLFERTIKIYGG